MVNAVSCIIDRPIRVIEPARQVADVVAECGLPRSEQGEGIAAVVVAGAVVGAKFVAWTARQQGAIWQRRVRARAVASAGEHDHRGDEDEQS